MTTKITTKDKILNAAEMLFANAGFAETSMRDITAKASVNLASVNYHFGSKKSLHEVNYDFNGKSALILGAGGVVPSIIQALKYLEVLNIHISTSTKENALKITTQYSYIYAH